MLEVAIVFCKSDIRQDLFQFSSSRREVLDKIKVIRYDATVSVDRHTPSTGQRDDDIVVFQM